MNRLNDADDGAEAVAAAGRGCCEITQLPEQIPTIGNVVALFGKRIVTADELAWGVGGVKSQRLAARCQLEIGVGWARAGFAIFAGREHDEIFAGIQRAHRKGPEPGQRRIIAQRPVREVHRLRTAIVDFDPIFECAVLVAESVAGNVRRENFVNHQIGQRLIWIERVIPRAAGKWICIRGVVGDGMSRTPRDGDRSGRWRREFENVRLPGKFRDVGGRNSIDQ